MVPQEAGVQGLFTEQEGWRLATGWQMTDMEGAGWQGGGWQGVDTQQAGLQGLSIEVDGWQRTAV